MLFHKTCVNVRLQNAFQPSVPCKMTRSFFSFFLMKICTLRCCGRVQHCFGRKFFGWQGGGGGCVQFFCSFFQKHLLLLCFKEGNIKVISLYLRQKFMRFLIISVSRRDFIPWSQANSCSNSVFQRQFLYPQLCSCCADSPGYIEREKLPVAVGHPKIRC